MSKDHFHLKLPIFQHRIKVTFYGPLGSSLKKLKPFLPAHMPQNTTAVSTRESAKHVVSTEDH